MLRRLEAAADESVRRLLPRLLGTRGRRLRFELLNDDDPRTIDEVAVVTYDVARVLALAHRLGIVHRDVKPEHVLYDRRLGRAVLIDFDLAYETTPTSPLVPANQYGVGTQGFMVSTCGSAPALNSGA